MDVCSASAKALVQITPKIVPSMIAFLKDKDENVRSQIVWVLDQMVRRQCQV